MADSLGQPSEAVLTTLNYITQIYLLAQMEVESQQRALVGNEQWLTVKGKTVGPLGREGTELLLWPARATL